MAPLTAEQMREKAKALSFEDVPIPQWGDGAFVRVQCISTRELDAFEAENFQRADGKVAVNYADVSARLLHRCIADEQGNLPFLGKPEEIAAWGADVTSLLYPVAERLSGLTKKAQEAIEKNSQSGPCAASSSSSPGT